MAETTHCYYLRLRGRLRCQLCERSVTRPPTGETIFVLLCLLAKQAVGFSLARGRR
jgi:hypothetical protein